MDKDAKLTLVTGNKIPIMGLGTWKLTDNTADIIEYALTLGYPMIDTSSDYGTQPGIGMGINQSGIKREDFYLVTKVEETDDAFERALSNLVELKLDFVDLTLIHRPPSVGAGERLWEGLIKARDEGLTRDIGVSNYTSNQIEDLIKATGEIPVVNQIEWSPFGHDKAMLDYAKKREIIIQAYSPLTRTERLDDPQLVEIAQKYSKSPAQILIRWNIQKGTIPISKANEKDHLKEDINVFDFEIEENDMKKLDGFNEEFSALGALPYT